MFDDHTNIKKENVQDTGNGTDDVNRSDDVNSINRTGRRKRITKSDKKPVSTNVIGQASILMAAGILVRIIGVLYRSPLTSIIGDEGNGYYSIAYNIYTMILLVASYSIPMAVSKVISGKLALKQYRDANRVLVCALLYVLVVGGIASLFSFFGAPFLIPESQSNAVPVLRVLAPTIFFSGFLGVFRGYFQAHGTMVQTSISQIIEQVANAVFSVGMALLFIRLFAGGEPERIPVFGAMGSATGTGVGVLSGLLFMLIIYRGNRRYFRKNIRRDVSGVKSSYQEIFRIIILMVTPVILSTFVYNISPILDQTLFCDIMDFKGMNAKDATTLYGVFATKYIVLMNVPVALANSMSTAMIPSVSSYYTLNDMDRCKAQVNQAIHFTMMISIPAAAGLCAMARPIMEVLFPQRDTIDLAVSLLRIGCLGTVFSCLSTVSNGILQGIGKVDIPLRNSAVSLILHLVFLTPLLLFTDLRLHAMVLATMTYNFLMCLFNNMGVKKYLGYRQEMKKTFIIPAISALIMGVLGYVFYQGMDMICGNLLTDYLPYRLIVLACMFISIIFCVVVYFVAELKLGGVTEKELKGFPKGGSLIRLARRFDLL